MSNTYCYWSIADGEYAPMMAAAISSARAVGVFKDFHVWTDQPIPGAHLHKIKTLDTRFGMFKFRFLRDAVKKLNYDYFIWLDADSWFVRNPGNPLRFLHHSPVHATLESNASDPRVGNRRWYDCRLSRYAELMDIKGVCSRMMFTCNAGFWIVHREVIDTFCDLAADFWMMCHQKGCRRFREEPALAYAAQMLCGNPYAHTLASTADLWATDRDANFRSTVPTGKSWVVRDPFSNKPARVNPAIVHLIRSKRMLARRGLQLMNGQRLPRSGRGAKLAVSQAEHAKPSRRVKLQQELV